MYTNSKKFCCEDISLIENYEQAINDDIQTWIVIIEKKQMKNILNGTWIKTLKYK